MLKTLAENTSLVLEVNYLQVTSFVNDGLGKVTVRPNP